MFFPLCMTYRKIPGINTYTVEQPDKEQEVIPPVTSIAIPNPEGDKLTSLDNVDVQLDSKGRGIIMSFFKATVIPLHVAFYYITCQSNYSVCGITPLKEVR